jgi:SAM-dependent methyltransferase
VSDYVRANEAAWDLVAAAKYAAEVGGDLELLRSGGTGLLEPELRLLGDLSGCGRAIHLQCSHGLDALSLWKLGAREVVGVDVSGAMLELARQKAERLGAPAAWVQSEVLAVPRELDGTADLVYTGKGALPWVSDLARWARVAARLLAPGGRLYVCEGHPLNRVWEPEADRHRLREDGGDYFERGPRANRDFPGLALENATPPGEPVPRAFEWQWTLGEVVTAVADAGLVVERLEEHPEHFWPQLARIPADEMRRLPHTFSLLARRPR